MYFIFTDPDIFSVLSLSFAFDCGEAVLICFCGVIVNWLGFIDYHIFITFRLCSKPIKNTNFSEPRRSDDEDFQHSVHPLWHSSQRRQRPGGPTAEENTVWLDKPNATNKTEGGLGFCDPFLLIKTISNLLTNPDFKQFPPCIRGYIIYIEIKLKFNYILAR